VLGDPPVFQVCEAVFNRGARGGGQDPACGLLAAGPETTPDETRARFV
jgi:hypothetical protein